MPKKSNASTVKNQALTVYEKGAGDLPAGERWITMNNALTRAGQGLTLSEKRVVMAAVSKLDSRRVYPAGEVPTTRITALEFATLFQIDPSTAYEQLQDAAKQLYNRSITFFEPAHKRNGQPLEPTRVTMRWVGQVHYQKGEGWVDLFWWPKLLPRLTGIQKQFTTYQLQQASALRSIYSWRLLEMLTRFKSSGVAVYTIEDFKASMDAPASLSDFGQIKRRIIDPAVKELTEKDGWIIQWEPIKAGRKVKKIRFAFTRDSQAGSLPADLLCAEDPVDENEGAFTND
jgi:plasmid replication initiation protein